MLELQNVEKRFTQNGRTFVAVHNVSLTINGGDFVVIRGKSGSGKSTLLSLMAGLQKQSSGSICFDGTEFSALKPKARSSLIAKNIAYIPQGKSAITSLSVKDNMRLPLFIQKRAGIKNNVTEAEIDSVLEQCGLSHLATSFPESLSGGEAQRLSIARALLSHPRLLLADEPTANLDKINTERVLSLLKRESQRGGAIVLVSHEDTDVLTEAVGEAMQLYQMQDGDLLET